jgi:hypothetical protein
MSLMNVKVGDEVVVEEYSGERRCAVESVGRKYLTAGGFEFDRESGRWNKKGYSGSKTVYTVARWDRKQAEDRFRKAARNLSDKLGYGGPVSAMDDYELNEARRMIDEIILLLESK